MKSVPPLLIALGLGALSPAQSLLLDIEPGPEGSSPQGFVALADRLLFFATTAEHGRELWVSDGTAGGTHLLQDLVPGPTPNGPPLTVTATGGRQPFRVGNEVMFWVEIGGRPRLARSDGTRAGTMLLPPLVTSDHAVSGIRGMDILHDRVLVAAGDATHRGSLWTLAPPDYAPVLRRTFADPIAYPTFAGERLLFLGQDGWSSMDPRGQVEQVLGPDFSWDLFRRVDPERPGEHYLRRGVTLLRTDGTAAGTRELGLASASDMFKLRGQIFAVALELVPPESFGDPTVPVLYRVEQNTLTRITPLDGEFVRDVICLEDRALITTFRRALRMERIWTTDGTTQGTVGIWPDYRTQILSSRRISGDRALFLADRTAFSPITWISDGTEVRSFRDEQIDEAAALFAAGKILFRGLGPEGWELWSMPLSSTGASAVEGLTSRPREAPTLHGGGLPFRGNPEFSLRVNRCSERRDGSPGPRLRDGGPDQHPRPGRDQPIPHRSERSLGAAMPGASGARGGRASCPDPGQSPDNGWTLGRVAGHRDPDRRRVSGPHTLANQRLASLPATSQILPSGRLRTGITGRFHPPQRSTVMAMITHTTVKFFVVATLPFAATSSQDPVPPAEFFGYTHGSWAPSGDALFCDSQRGGGSTLRVSLQGGSVQVLPRPMGHPRPSPDGQWLAGEGPGGDIYILHLETGETRHLTEHPAPDLLPFWSRDGGRIGFTSTRDGNPEIYAMPVEGGEARRLTEHEATDMALSWSPREDAILFHSNRDGQWDLYTVSVQDGTVHRLTENPAVDRFAVWSPSGDSIAFTREVAGNSEIYLLDPERGATRPLTDHPAIDTYVMWSPDGKRLSFQSDREGGTDLYSIARDGSDLRRHTTGEHFLDFLDRAGIEAARDVYRTRRHGLSRGFTFYRGVMSRRARALCAAEAFEEAREILELVVDHYPNSTEDRILLAKTWIELGVEEAAQQELEAVLQRHGNHALARRILAHIGR